MFENLNIHTSGILAIFKAKQFRKIIPTYTSNIYRLPKFGILGSEHYFTGRAAPGKIEKKRVCLQQQSKPPSLPFSSPFSVSSISQ